MKRGRSYTRSHSQFLAAQNVIPGGVHKGGVPLLQSDTSPMYFERGKGCYIWDIDGNKYIDFILAYGAILLGYAHEEVDAAAIEQISLGKLLTLNHPLHLTFAESILRRFPAADMAYFMKTGSEATTAALRVARLFTGRKKVIRCGFHGWHDWCFPDDESVPAGLNEQVQPLKSVSADLLSELLSVNSNQIAAVIVAPEMVMPLTKQTFQAMIDVTHANGALFIMDEVKTGFRAPGGSIQQFLGVKPDLTTVSKGLGNGWPVSVLLGKRNVMQAGKDTHLSATYHGETAAMAAALKSLEVIDRQNVQNHIWTLGERLIAGLNELVERHQLQAKAYAEPIPSMPFLAFTDSNEQLNEAARSVFFSEMFNRGILLHPRHLWYTSLSHTEAHIDETLAAADEAMEITKKRMNEL